MQEILEQKVRVDLLPDFMRKLVEQIDVFLSGNSQVFVVLPSVLHEVFNAALHLVVDHATHVELLDEAEELAEVVAIFHLGID